MLCQFSFENFKSFKSEAFLDFMAESIKDNENSIIVDKIDREQFLPVIAIYGPNGGGKSTVLEALRYLKDFILQTIILSNVNSIDQNEDAQRIIKRFVDRDFKDNYHKFDPKFKDIPTRFDIMFRCTDKQYRYQLAVKHGVIFEETLYMRIVGEKDATIIFDRSQDECFLGEELEGIAVEKLKNTMPLISHIAINYDIEAVDEAVKWFMAINFVDYDNPRRERQIIIPKTKKQRVKMFEMLQKMDINISDFRIEKDIDGKVENIYTRHVLENGEIHEILFEDESSGTRKLFSCLAEIMDCLREGSLMVADELDAKLHPKLLRYIVELFTNRKSNRKGAQLLLTSHDMTTMIPEVFRRDEIWFCALNPQNASKLYSLISFKKESGQILPSDESYGKEYLEGRYGADPYIRKILDWGSNK